MKYAEAEPLLLVGYDGMMQRIDRIPPRAFQRLKEALQRLVQLYQNTGRPERAREWNQKLAEFESGLLRRERADYLARLHTAAEKGDARAMNELAWLQATSTDPALRDGASAVRFAEQAVAKTERKDWMVLDTLAAAYAEAGEFARAVNAQREAISLCRDEKMKSDMATKLKLYESNTPFRDANR